MPKSRTERRAKAAPETPVHVVARPEALRWTILAGLAFLAAITVSIAGRASQDAPLVMLSALAFTGALLWFGHALWRTRARAVTFDGETLADDDGCVLCTLDEIEEVERGMALFKPSSGFALRLKVERPRAWSPGLWWRVGRRVGVGGATPGRSARNMADAIVAAAAIREAARQSGDAEG